MSPTLGPIVSFLLNRSRARLLAVQERNKLSRGRLVYGEGQAQSKWRKVEKFDFSQRIPFFGTAPSTFADYAQYRSIPAPVMGVVRKDVPKPTWHNIQGLVRNWKPNPNLPKPYVDPAISHQGKLTYEKTDQQPISGRRSSGVVEPVFNQKKSSGFEGRRGKTEPTEADKIALEMKREPYSFF